MNTWNFYTAFLRIGALFFILISLNVKVNAQQDSLKEKILNVINQSANYSSDILLDSDGKSRCEYSIMEGKWYPYEVAWHTGQIINSLVEAYKITNNKKYLDNAKRAGDWWCGLLITDHPVLKGMVKAIHGEGVDYLIFATVSDGTPGLFNLYKETGIPKYADVPVSAGKWMLKNLYIPEHGVSYDAVDYNTGEVQKNRSPFWKNKTNQTLFDLARPNNEGSLFKDIYEYTGDDTYKKVFINLCNSLVEKQGPEGLWMDFTPNDKETGAIHPRFNLWNAESLLEGYDLTNDKRYLAAAKKTLDFFTKLQKKDGTIYYNNYIDLRYETNSLCGSASSFAGLLWIRLVGYGVGEEYLPNIERSFNWIMKNRYPVNHPDKNLAGGMVNTKQRIRNGIQTLMQRDIGSSFGIRFLASYYKWKGF